MPAAVVELLFFRRLGCGLGAGCVHLGAQAANARVQPRLDVGKNVPLGVVGLVEREGLATHGLAHIVGNARGDGVFQRLAAPVGENLLAQLPDLLRADVEAILGSRRQDFQLLIHPIHCPFGRDDAHTRQQGSVGDDQLVRVDGDAHRSHQVQQHLGTAGRHRLAFAGAVAFGRIAGALDVDLARRREQPFFDGRKARRRSRGRPCVWRKAITWLESFSYTYW